MLCLLVAECGMCVYTSDVWYLNTALHVAVMMISSELLDCNLYYFVLKIIKIVIWNYADDLDY